MTNINTPKLNEALGRELDVFVSAPRIGKTPTVTEIAAMIKGGKPGDMDKLDV